MVGLVFGAGCGASPRTHTPPTISFWSWTSPYRFDQARSLVLRELGVSEVYVRAATVSFDGGRLVPSFPTAFEPSDWSPDVWLVVNFDAGALRHMGEFGPRAVAEAIMTAYWRAFERAKKAGTKPSGLQLDIDVPTSRLSAFGEVVDAIRSLEPGLKVQATGLQDWLNSHDMEGLAAKLDTFLPQFYEGHLPDRFEDDVPLGDLAALKRWLPKLGRLPVRCVVGVPSYTQSLLFSPTGKRLGTVPGLSLLDALDHRGLRLISRREVQGEWHYRFLGTAGAGQGTRLLYRSVGPQRLAAFVRALDPPRPANVAGFAVFRLPREGDEGAVSLPGVRASLAPGSPGLRIRVSMEKSAKPFGGIERGDASSDQTVRLVVDNLGPFDTLPGESSVEVLVRFRAGSLGNLSAGVATACEPFVGAPGGAIKVGIARADGVRFRLTSLKAGERRRLGPLTFVESTEVQTQWTVEGPDGRRTTGETEIEVGE